MSSVPERLASHNGVSQVLLEQRAILENATVGILFTRSRAVAQATHAPGEQPHERIGAGEMSMGDSMRTTAQGASVNENAALRENGRIREQGTTRTIGYVNGWQL